MNKLEKLLYRKESCIRLMNIWAKGIQMYDAYIKICQEVVDHENSTNLDIIEAKKAIHECEIPLKHYITSHKLAQREHDHYILPEIEKNTTEEEREGIEFADTQKMVAELADIEIYGKHVKQPDNVELEGVSKDIQDYIDLLKTSVEVSSAHAENTDDALLKAKLNLEVFKMNLQIMTLEKRLSERNDYYYNVFKPKYDREMIEADEYLPKLLKRAHEIVKLGIDPKLSFMLSEYEKNKEDREKVWLFYTALKSRLKKIGKEMRKNKNKFKGKMHLAQEIVK
jgi:hypothetical protein